MTYQPARELARQARSIADDVTAEIDRTRLVSFGNYAMAPLGSLATAIEVLAKAVEQLADDLEIHEH